MICRGRRSFVNHSIFIAFWAICAQALAGSSILKDIIAKAQPCEKAADAEQTAPPDELRVDSPAPPTGASQISLRELVTQLKEGQDLKPATGGLGPADQAADDLAPSPASSSPWAGLPPPPIPPGQPRRKLPPLTLAPAPPPAIDGVAPVTEPPTINEDVSATAPEAQPAPGFASRFGPLLKKGGRAARDGLNRLISKVALHYNEGVLQARERLLLVRMGKVLRRAGVAGRSQPPAARQPHCLFKLFRLRRISRT